MENPNYIMREITPLSERDCFYIADRRKTEFTYPIHCHAEYELNFTEHASGVRRVVGDSAEVIGDYDLVLITGKELENALTSPKLCHNPKDISGSRMPLLPQRRYFILLSYLSGAGE